MRAGSPLPYTLHGDETARHATKRHKATIQYATAQGDYTTYGQYLSTDLVLPANLWAVFNNNGTLVDCRAPPAY